MHVYRQFGNNIAASSQVAAPGARMVSYQAGSHFTFLIQGIALFNTLSLLLAVLEVK